MKKPLAVTVFGAIILIIVILIIVFKKDNSGNIMDGPGMINEVSSYSVNAKQRPDFPGEDIYVYDGNGNLVFSLENNEQPQYLLKLYEKYLILDSGTSASQREILVYDVSLGKLIYKTDYYPGEDGLVMNDNNITFYKKIDESLYGDYTLPNCQNEYDNGYIENYGYTIGEDQANDLGDIQCAYFE